LRVEYRKKFLKELAQIPAENRAQKERFVCEQIPEKEKTIQSTKFEAMKGQPAVNGIKLSLEMNSHHELTYGSGRNALKEYQCGLQLCDQKGQSPWT